MHDKCKYIFRNTHGASQTFWTNRILKPLQVIVLHYIQLLTEEVLLNPAQNHGPGCQCAISLGSPQHTFGITKAAQNLLFHC